MQGAQRLYDLCCGDVTIQYTIKFFVFSKFSKFILGNLRTCLLKGGNRKATGKEGTS
jgi:hypothetical protein